MTKVLICSSDGNLVADLRGILTELGNLEFGADVLDPDDMVGLVARVQPEVAFVHEEAGLQLVREISVRFPGTAVLCVAEPKTPAKVVRALEAGARGVIGYPFAYEDVAQQVDTATSWSDAMRSVLDGAAVSTGRRGKLLAVVGAKGGVGTTTLATHLALNHLVANPDSRVCLIDGDVEKGDVSGILDVRQAVSIAGVARVADDMTSRTVADALVHHESGLHLLLAPLDVRESEDVTPEAMRSILDLLRREFDLVVVDGGGHITPSQAAVMEVADHRLIVTTPDVMSVRAMRRRIQGWEKLGVTEEAACTVVVNRTVKGSIFPASAVPQLTVARVLGTSLPEAPRSLEPAMNDRDPRSVTEAGWWKLIRELRADLGLAEGRHGRPVPPPAAGDTEEESTAPRRGLLRRKRRGAAGAPPSPAATPPDTPVDDAPTAPRPTSPPAADGQPPPPPGQPSAAPPPPPSVTHAGPRERGAIALENAAMIPFALVLAVLCWQIAVIGLTFVYSGHASSAAAREYSISQDESAASRSAKEAVPDSFGTGLDVSSTPTDEIVVTMRVPMSFSEVPGLPETVTTTRHVLEEPT